MTNRPATAKVVRVNDNCGLGKINPIDHERATGILAIHRSCDPPCPRKAAAQAWLDKQEKR
ncbi:hypothetical protein [Nocardia sp. NPDC051832]|uniref:hypothetical protein n=1 Tax=Nocardia sp. NPDC051832 TaxID=3155673 RepID=UPI003413DA52